MVKLTRLKDIRQRKALTQQQLADRAGVNRVTIARIEGGKDEPFPTTVRKVADALGVEPEDLLGPAAEPVANRPSNEPVAVPPLDKRITVVDEENVARLLQAEPDLVPLINEAVDQITRIIPVPDARFRLEYLVDPEYGDTEELFLGPSCDLELDPKAALDLLRRFDREWWVHNSRRGGGLLIVDLY
jgi:transcriptional regulator with XRE-family HTH domain